MDLSLPCFGASALSSLEWHRKNMLSLTSHSFSKASSGYILPSVVDIGYMPAPEEPAMASRALVSIA